MGYFGRVLLRKKLSWTKTDRKHLGRKLSETFRKMESGGHSRYLLVQDVNVMKGHYKELTKKITSIKSSLGENTS